MGRRVVRHFAVVVLCAAVRVRGLGAGSPYAALKKFAQVSQKRAKRGLFFKPVVVPVRVLVPFVVFLVFFVARRQPRTPHPLKGLTRIWLPSWTPPLLLWLKPTGQPTPTVPRRNTISFAKVRRSRKFRRTFTRAKIVKKCFARISNSRYSRRSR